LAQPVSATVAGAALGLAAVDLGRVAERLAMLGNRGAPKFRHPQAPYQEAHDPTGRALAWQFHMSDRFETILVELGIVSEFPP
jgi:hypothetical protein